MIVINGFSRKIPLIDDKGCPTQWMQIFGEQVRNLPTIVATGNPNGAYSANAGRFYIDTSGAPGSKLWIKVFDSVAGDDAQGWELS